MAGIFFIVIFAIIRISLAFIFKDRYGNAMVRILKFDYEEIERDFRIVFKNQNIRFYRKFEEDGYCYEFPGHNLTMTAKPYWLSGDIPPCTKVTLYAVNAKNEAFAEILATSIDEMIAHKSLGTFGGEEKIG